MKIAIITAMQSEYDAVHALYQFKDDELGARTIAHGKNIVLIKSGMGKVNAAIATERACRDGADIVINTGLAGGIDQSLTQGDIVLADRVCYHDVWCGEPNEYGQVQDLPLYYDTTEYIEQIKKDATDFKVGLIVTGDQFLTDINRLKEIKQRFPEGLATDMESAAVAQTCYLNQVGFISLRIISDVVGKEGQMDEYQNFWKQVPHKAADMVDKTLKAIQTDEIIF